MNHHRWLYVMMRRYERGFARERKLGTNGLGGSWAAFCLRSANFYRLSLQGSPAEACVAALHYGGRS